MISPSESLLQIFSSQSPFADDNDYREFDTKLGFLDRLAEVENSSITVLDLYKRKYIYIRSKFIDRFDNAIIEHDATDPLYYTQLIHPDDLHSVLDSYRKTFKFLNNVPIEERKDYKLILNFRQLDKSRNYVSVILQLVVLELDKKDNIWLVLIIDDLLPEKISFKEVNRRLVNIRTGKICLFRNDSEPKKRSILSSREIEVLGLVSKGFVSKQIADRLFLSVNTVNNHRQNILDKVQAANTSEAVSYARNLGLI